MRARKRAASATPPVHGGVRVTNIRMRRREDGQTMAEYAVVIGVITPFLVLAFAAMGDAIVARLETVIGFLS